VSFLKRIPRIAFAGLLLILVASKDVRGQSQFMDLAPLSEVGHARYADDLETTLILVGIERSMPIGSLLPQVTPDSYLTFLRLLVGIRLEGTDAVFRGRATAVDFTVQKMPWAASFSFLDFDASGYRSFSSDWISLGIGPGFDVGDRELRISGRVIGVGAFNSTRLGSTVLRGDTLDEDKTRHSLSYGARGQASLVIQEIVQFSARYELIKYSIDSEIEYSNRGGLLRISPMPGIQLFGSYERIRYQLGGKEKKLNVFGFGLTVTPSSF